MFQPATYAVLAAFVLPFGIATRLPASSVPSLVAWRHGQARTTGEIDGRTGPQTGGRAVAPGPLAYYPFDGGDGDASGHGYDAIARGGVTYVVGVAGLAASFDGIDDYVEVPRSIADSFSVAFWVRTAATAPTATQWFEGLGLVDMEVCGSPAEGDWGIALINGGHVIWGSSAHLESAVDVNDGAWHLVVVTRAVTDGMVALYVDGVEQGRGLASPTTSITGSSWIGVGNNPCDVSFNRRWFPGDIDELYLYDRVLSKDEIVGFGGDLVFFDDFESGTTGKWSTP